MRVEGAIVPAGEGSRVNRDAWCRLIDSCPELRRPQPRQAINPFTREPMVVWPSDDFAQVVIEGIAVGDVYWSMSDQPLINVSIERSALPLVLQWAAELGGEFREDP